MANQSDISQSYLKKNEYRKDNLPDGLSNSVKIEDIPNYAETGCETVYSGKNNTFIVFGRDRPSDRNSGYGGIGEKKSGTIDIVAGRLSNNPQTFDSNGQPLWVNNNVWRDASRIYISQRTDVDVNYRIAAGSSGIARNSPAIAIKSDHVRLIGRKSIKIVTGTDSFDGLDGNKILTSATIDLLGGNSTDIQPLVKGNNLKEVLIEITEKLNNTIGILSNFVKMQMEFNNSISNHTHLSPFFGQPTSPSPALVTEGIKLQIDNFKDNVSSLMAAKANLVGIQVNYLQDTGEKYINSSFVNTT